MTTTATCALTVLRAHDGRRMAKAFSVATNGQIGALARHLARQVRHADA